jgi:hypothetical protein
MRHAPAVGAFWLVLVLGSPALAQGPPDRRTVKVDVAEVRSGPSTNDQFYVTNRLPRGAVVEVVRERDGGWLEIRPPAGSFSWIKTVFLEHIDAKQPNYVVALEGTPVPVYIGSEFVRDHRPTVVGARLERGTQVTSTDHKINRDSEGSWMRIDPPATEVRYLRAEAVERNPSAAGGLEQASTSGAGLAGLTEGLQRSSAPSANPPLTPEELWRQAQRAESDGKIAEAVRLYAQVAAGAVQRNPRLASDALERANYLQGGHRDYGAAAAVPAPPAGPAAPPAAPPVVGIRVSGPRSTQDAPLGTTTSTFTERGANPARTTATTRQPPPGYVSYTGKLFRAGRNFEDGRMYRLESAQLGVHLPLTYVIAGPGVNLEAHVGKVVEVWGLGSSRYNGELRGNLLRATQVYPQQ